MSPILGGRGAGVRAYGFGGAGAPNQVTGLSATDVGSGRAYNNGRIDLSWTAPANNGAPITGYKIERSTDNSTFTTLVADTGSSSTSYSNTSLTSAQIYYYKVSAINTVGTGLASASASATATTIPQTPTITSATRSSNTAVSIAFTGATGGAALTAVTATSSPSVSITSSGTSSPMTATATYVQGTSYTFTITATNTNGTSSSSGASSTVTPYPSPTISSWSSATAFPITNNLYGEARSVGASLAITAGGGYGYTGQSTYSYSYDGSTWNSVSTLNAVVLPNLAADKTTSTAQSMGGYYVVGEDAYSANQSRSWTPGGAWSSTTHNIGDCWAGAAIAWPSNVWSVNQGNAATATYYRTGTNAFSTGVAMPNVGSGRGHYAYGLGYTFYQNGPIYTLTQTSAGGAYTVAATGLAGAANGSWIKLNVASGALFYCDTTVTPLAVYRYNSDFTSTLMTSPSVANWNSGMMASAGSTMFITGGRISSSNTTTTQQATVS